MIFVTYSWINDQPDKDVLRLVEELRSSGYPATCDVMAIQRSTSISFFQMMAENLKNADKVIVVLTQSYKEKADSFNGGVGNEYRYIISDIEENKEKYIFVTFSSKRNNVIPNFLVGREVLYIDITSTSADKYCQLLHRINASDEYLFSEVNPNKILPSQKKMHSTITDKQSIPSETLQLVSLRCAIIISEDDGCTGFREIHSFPPSIEECNFLIELKYPSTQPIYINSISFLWEKNEIYNYTFTESIIIEIGKTAILTLPYPHRKTFDEINIYYVENSVHKSDGIKINDIDAILRLSCELQKYGSATNEYQNLINEINNLTKEENLTQSSLNQIKVHGVSQQKTTDNPHAKLLNGTKSEEAKSSNDNTNNKKIIGKVVAVIGFSSAIIGIFVFFTGKNLPDFFPASSNAANITNKMQQEDFDYFISIAVSDTLSTNLAPAKKIVATASADSTNMIITAESSAESYGPYNMTMESTRRFSFIAVFEDTDVYTVTITAYDENGETTTQETIIAN